MRFPAGLFQVLIAFIGCSQVSSMAKSKVLVHIPFEIHKPEGFAHVQAEFGFSTVSSGRSVAEYTYYVEHALCEPLTNFTEGYPKRGHHLTHLTPPFILMANEGGCSAVTKARHAQQVGAAALLIAHLKCLCSDTDCMNKFKNQNDTADCLTEEPALVDDGSGSDISIPTFLVYKELTSELHNQMKQKNQPCLLEFQWGIQDGNMEGRVPRFHLWTTAYDPLVSLEFYVGIKTVAQGFKDKVEFAPRFSLIDGKRFKCDEQPDEHAPCDHLCTNHGRYCTLHAKDLSGNAIVHETLRRLCIWKHYGNSTADKYWAYTIYHKQLCSEPHSFADPKCIADGFKEAGIHNDIVESCMKDAGELDQDGTNTLLEEELTHQNRSSVVSLPALSVNRKVLHWTSAHSLYETLCTEYWLSGVKEVPEVCVKCASCPNAVGCIEKGHCVEFENDQRHPDTGYHRSKSENDKGKKKHRGRKFFWFLVIMGSIGGAYYYYDKHRDQFGTMRHRGNGGLMNDYMHLPGEE